MTKFFRIINTNLKSTISVEPRFEYELFEFLTKEFLIDKDLNLNTSKGKKLPDWIKFQYSFCNYCVSEELYKVLKNFKGIEFTKCYIEKKKISIYIVHVVTEVGEILNKDDLNNYRTNKVEFDLKTWDGSDIFYFKDTRTIACTEKVKDAVEGNFTNIEFEDIT